MSTRDQTPGIEIPITLRADLGLPPGGKWFYTQDAMMQHKKKLKTGVPFVLSWDKDIEKRNKYFGVYESPRAFWESVQLSGLRYRYAYEMIPENTPCRLYMDIEWKGEADKTHERIMDILNAFQEYCINELRRLPCLHLLCGSRPVSGTDFKNSYHLVATDIFFRNNHDGQMLDWVRNFVYAYDVCKDQNKQSFVDLLVYSRNRCMRSYSSCKKGETVPLLYLNPAEEMDMDTDNIDYFLGTLSVEYSSIAEENFVPEKPLKRGRESPGQSGAASSAQPQRPNATSHPLGASSSHNANPSLESNSHPLPFSAKIIADALIVCGDNRTTIGRISGFTNLATGKMEWKIQGTMAYCAQGDMGRPCLISSGVFHRNNNCLLFVTSTAQEARYTLKYVCMSSRCRGSENGILLGHIFFKQGGSGWVFEQFEAQQDAPVLSSDDEQPDHEMDDDQTSFCGTAKSSEVLPYEDVKLEFEKTCFKVMNPFFYIRVVPQSWKGYQLYDHYKWEKNFMNLRCTITTDNPEKPTKVVRFVPKWFEDKDMRTVECIDMDPLGIRPNIFNLWRGYVAQDLPTEGYDIDEKIAPIIKHLLEVVCEGVQEHLDYVLQWMGNIVQRPHLKTGVSILLYGEEGCGKGVIFEWFREDVLGKYHTSQTAAPEIDLFGRFASGAVGKVFVQIDECKKIYEYHDQLKNLITSNTIRVEEKNKDPYTVLNLCNLLFTTNNTDCIRINPRERRMVLFKCNDKYKDNARYFIDLVAHLKSEGTAACFFEFLRQIDLGSESRNFQENRPKTELYRQRMLLSIPLHMRFVSAIVKDGVGERFTLSKDVWDQFLTWNNEQKKNMHGPQRNDFFYNLSQIKGVVMESVDGQDWVRINLALAKDYLIQNDMFDPSATR